MHSGITTTRYAKNYEYVTIWRQIVFFLFKNINNSKPPKNLPKCYGYLNITYKPFLPAFSES